MISAPFLPTTNPWAEPAMNQAHDRRTKRKHLFGARPIDMKDLKILHLARDEKFVDQGLRAFEQAAPGANDLYLYAPKDLKYVKSPAKIASRKELRTGNLSKEFVKYDLIIIHSLIPAWLKTLSKISKETPLVWLGWGYDYYDLIHSSRNEMLLPLTQKAMRKQAIRSGVLTRLIRLAKRRLNTRKKKKLISQISFFAPVLANEYSIVKEKFADSTFPQYISWNYGNLERMLSNGLQDSRTNGAAILVGNSASAENNHIDLFSLLTSMGVSKRKIISPLSYGDDAYKDLVIKYGKSLLGDDFEPITEFMPLSQYMATLRACGFVIMNHVRQQAVGNIVIMLYMGAKVFLRAECPTYAFLREQGAIVYTVQELEKNPRLLDETLDDISILKNRKILEKNWSDDVGGQKTLNLLRLATGRNLTDRDSVPDYSSRVISKILADSVSATRPEQQSQRDMDLALKREMQRSMSTSQA